MLRGTAVVLAMAVLTSGATAASAGGAPPPGFNLVARAELYRGVDYLKLAKTNLPVIAHVAHVAPGAPIDLRVVNADDKISTSTRELETTSSMCRRVRCVVGVNGDFHTAGAPAGGVVVDGRMLHSPDPGRPQLTMTADGRLVAGPLPWSGSFTANGVEIPLTAVNAAPPADGLALYTPAYGDRTEPSARTELVVGAVGGVASLNKPAALQLRGVRSGAGPIPADGAVLSGDGAAGQRLRDIWARRPTGATAPAQLVVSSPVNAVVSLGAEPVVLRDGKRALPWRDPNLINPRQPHTLVGWNKAGDIYLIAVDGRQPGSDGVTMAEAADFLLGLGVTDAVNLDGGGGTTFVAGGSVWNRPSDNDPARPAEHEERGGTNALVVTSRPGAPLPPASPTAPKSLGTAPSGSPIPGTQDAGIGSDSGPDHPLDGADGLPFGPVTGVGGELAAGDLPLGPASATRSASASPSGAAGVDLSGAGPQGVAGPPTAGAHPGGGGGSERARGGPIGAASTLTRHLVDATAGNRSPWPLLGFVAGLALVAAGTAPRPRVGERRRPPSDA
jgi:hypothetical protein